MSTNVPQRRRQQNREYQRAFRQRKNLQFEQLEQSLADLQRKHEKLLQCFVGLTSKVSLQSLESSLEDMGFVEEQLREYNSHLGKGGFKISSEKLELIRSKSSSPRSM